MLDLVEIVDDKDKVIGTATPKEVHEKNLLHRSSMIFCFKDSSFREILVTKRSMKLYMPGLLCFPGGHLDHNETYEQCAKREFIEEVANNLKPEGFEVEELFKIKKDADADPEFMTVFRTVYPGPFVTDEDEVSDYGFENVNTVEEMINNPEIFAETPKVAFKEYLKILEKINV